MYSPKEKAFKIYEYWHNNKNSKQGNKFYTIQKTYDLIKDENIKINLKFFILKNSSNVIDNNKKSFFIYKESDGIKKFNWNLTSEKEAREWVVKFLKNNNNIFLKKKLPNLVLDYFLKNAKLRFGDKFKKEKTYVVAQRFKNITGSNIKRSGNSKLFEIIIKSDNEKYIKLKNKSILSIESEKLILEIKKNRKKFILKKIEKSAIVTNINLKSTISKIYKNKDYESENKKRKESGDKAEKVVLEYEKKFLIKNRLIKLSKLVQQVSLKNNSLGYDILSFYKNGLEKKIEVKNTTTSNSFIVSANEDSKLLKGETILYLVDINKKEILEISKENYEMFGKNPIQYKLIYKKL